MIISTAQLQRSARNYNKYLAKIKSKIEKDRVLYGEPVIFFNNYYVVTQGKHYKHTYLYHNIFEKQFKIVSEE